MELKEIIRPFYPYEIRCLGYLKSQYKKNLNIEKHIYFFLIVIILAAMFHYFAANSKSDFLFFVFGTIAVLSYSCIVFLPYEVYKQRKRTRLILMKIERFIEKGTVLVKSISAKRIAIAKEYEDGSDLYIIEYEKDMVLYIWDLEFNLHKKLPCLDFEIYENDFFELLGRQIYTQSKKIVPIIIDKKTKWNYLGEYGGPENLSTENINFDVLLERFNSCKNR